jgi:hypothetical protein
MANPGPAVAPRGGFICPKISSIDAKLINRHLLNNLLDITIFCSVFVLESLDLIKLNSCDIELCLSIGSCINHFLQKLIVENKIKAVSIEHKLLQQLICKLYIVIYCYSFLFIFRIEERRTRVGSLLAHSTTGTE